MKSKDIIVNTCVPQSCEKEWVLNEGVTGGGDILTLPSTIVQSNFKCPSKVFSSFTQSVRPFFPKVFDKRVLFIYYKGFLCFLTVHSNG